MNVPPDYAIEHNLVNFHVWVICQRLSDYGKEHKEADVLRRGLVMLIEEYVNTRSIEVFLKSKNDFIKEIESFLRLNRNTYDYHFKQNPRTMSNNNYKIDALAWSTVFQEKVDRYSPEVFLMGEYMVKTYEYFQNVSYEDIEKGHYNFDVFRCDLDYFEKISKINPPLSEEEFNAELDSPDTIKKFFYNYEDEEYEMPIDVEKKKLINHRYDEMKLRLYKTMKKFESIDTYDYYNDRDEAKEESRRVEEKYVWKQKKDHDFDLFKNMDMNEIKKKYRDENSVEI